MKYAVIALALALFAVAHAASEAGQFVPRAFFTLDSEGHQSNVHPVNAHLLKRLRRQVFSSSSSSSSFSSSSGNGHVITTSNQQVVNPDGSSFSGGTIQHIAQPIVEIGQRFGEDSSSSYAKPAASSFGAQTAGTQSYGTPQGVVISYTGSTDAAGNQKYHETHGTIGNDGQWKYNQTSIVYPRN